MVLETIRIANGKFLQLVKAGEQYFVIAVGKDEVTKIAELTEDKKDILYTVINICNSSVCGSVVCLTKQNDCLCSFHGSGQH